MNSINHVKKDLQSYFTSSESVKKEINNILKIYSECNQNLIVDIMNLLRHLDKSKFSTLQSSSNSPSVGINFKSDTIEDEVESSKIFANQTYKFFCKALVTEKSVICDVQKEFEFQTKNKDKKINIEKFPSIKNLNKLIDEYKGCEPRYEKPLLFDADIKIEILNINNPSYYQLSIDEAKWLDDQVLHFPTKNMDYRINLQFVKVGPNGSLLPQPSNTEEELTHRCLKSILGKDESIRKSFKNKKITHLHGDLKKLPNFCMVKFVETNQLKTLQKCSLIFQSFKSFLTHQTEAIQHVYHLFQEYNEMIDLEKEVAKKIREEMCKTAPEQKSEIQFTPEKKEFTQSHNKKNRKEPELSKKEKIILENSQKSTQTPETKPSLPIIYTTDISLIETFQAIMKGSDSKITWKEAIDCCSKLGYSITPCGGSIYKFVYQNSLKALIPEKELEKFVETIQEEKIEKSEKTEEIKTSKNIHAPHREGQSHNEPLYPKLKNRFKLLFEETGFTFDHLKLEEKKEIKN